MCFYPELEEHIGCSCRAYSQKGMTLSGSAYECATAMTKASQVSEPVYAIPIRVDYLIVRVIAFRMYMRKHKNFILCHTKSTGALGSLPLEVMSNITYHLRKLYYDISDDNGLTFRHWHRLIHCAQMTCDDTYHMFNTGVLEEMANEFHHEFDRVAGDYGTDDEDEDLDEKTDAAAEEDSDEDDMSGWYRNDSDDPRDRRGCRGFDDDYFEKLEEFAADNMDEDQTARYKYECHDYDSGNENPGLAEWLKITAEDHYSNTFTENRSTFNSVVQALERIFHVELTIINAKIYDLEHFKDRAWDEPQICEVAIMAWLHVPCHWNQIPHSANKPIFPHDRYNYYANAARFVMPEEPNFPARDKNVANLERAIRFLHLKPCVQPMQVYPKEGIASKECEHDGAKHMNLDEDWKARIERCKDYRAKANWPAVVQLRRLVGSKSWDADEVEAQLDDDFDDDDDDNEGSEAGGLTPV